jgi:hypothetical protein
VGKGGIWLEVRKIMGKDGVMNPRKEEEPWKVPKVGRAEGLN